MFNAIFWHKPMHELTPNAIQLHVFMVLVLVVGEKFIV
jgi:hypothetical protein